VKCLIIDFHVGCIQSLFQTLASNEIEIDIVSFSGHNHFLSDSARTAHLKKNDFEIVKKLIFPDIAIDEMPSIQTAVRCNGIFSGKSSPIYDVAFVMFPPALFERVLKSGIAKHVVVIASHRMDLWIENPIQRRRYWKSVQSELSAGNITVIAASVFDAKYIEHYLNTSIEVYTPFIGLGQLKENENKKEILIGPSNISSSNRLVRKVKSKLGLETIKDRYENASLENLNSHLGFVIIPYSIYSISLTELMAMGKFLLVPKNMNTVKFGLLQDVRLYPIYGKAWKIIMFEIYNFFLQGKTKGPNSIGRKSREKWLSYASWQGYDNLIYWSSVKELKDILHDINEQKPLPQETTNLARQDRYRELMNSLRQLTE
jgi:hypothetical protein